MQPDPSEIQKLTERVEKLEKDVLNIKGPAILICIIVVVVYLTKQFS